MSRAWPTRWRPRAGDSFYRPELSANDHAVQSLDWFFPTLGEMAIDLETPAAVESRQARLAAARKSAEAKAREALATDPKLLAEFENTLSMAQRLQPDARRASARVDTSLARYAARAGQARRRSRVTRGN